MKLEGVLYGPAGPLVGAKVLIKATETTAKGMLGKSQFGFISSHDGSYSVDIQPGEYIVTLNQVRLGIMKVEGEGPSTIPELLGSEPTPTTPSI